MATVDDLMGFKSKLMSNLYSSDDRGADTALLRAINKAIDKPPLELGQMSRDDLKSYISQESLAEPKAGPSLLNVFGIPGAATMELPSQIYKHGLKKGAIRTAEALGGMREHEVPLWERLPADVVAFGALGGLRKTALRPYAKGTRITGKPYKQLADPYERVSVDVTRPTVTKIPRQITAPQKQITGGREIRYGKGAVEQPYRITEKVRGKAKPSAGYLKERYHPSRLPKQIETKGRVFYQPDPVGRTLTKTTEKAKLKATTKPTPMQDFTRKAGKLADSLGIIDKVR